MSNVSQTLTIAEAVKTAIQGVEHGGSALTAEVGLAADFDLSTDASRRIIICPTGCQRELDDRGSADITLTYTIVILEKIEVSDLDDRLKMVEDISAAIEAVELTDACTAGLEFSPLYNIQSLCEMHLFESVINLTVKAV